MITLTFVTGPHSRDKTYRYKTLGGAMKKAHSLVGRNPRLDPDGYAVSRSSGKCLFFQGSTFEELFPMTADSDGTTDVA